MSGGKFERLGLMELVDHARPGSRLCVKRLDRLGRSLKDLLETAEGLKRRRIHLVSLEESIDTASSAGELVFHVFGAIAHFERRLIVERTLGGRRGEETGPKPGTTSSQGGNCGSPEDTGRCLLDAGTGGRTTRDRTFVCLQDCQGNAAQKVL